jgi:hypothetical protein
MIFESVSSGMIGHIGPEQDLLGQRIMISTLASARSSATRCSC